MKNYLKSLALSLIMIFGAKGAFSQVNYNVQAGINLSSMSNNIMPDVATKIGIRAGVGINYNFSKYFSVDPSLLIVTKGFRQPDLSFSVNPSYIQIPVNITLNLPLSRDVKVLFGAGPYVAYGIGGKGTLKLDSGETISDSPLFSNNVVSMVTYKKRFDAGLTAYIGFMYRDIVLSAGGDIGMTAVNNIEINSNKNFNNSFNITLSYRFNYW